MKNVRVDLNYYEQSLAEDLSVFTNHHVENLSQLIELTRDLVGQNHLRFSEDEARENIDKGERILRSWQLYLGEDGSLPADDLCYWFLLKDAHAEYRQRFAAQERLPEGDVFNPALGRAFARIPFAKRLELHESLSQGKYILDQVHDLDALRETMVCTVPWNFIRANNMHDLSQPPAELLFKVPAAIRKAGVLLSALDIDTLPQDYSRLVASKQDLVDLTAAVQNVKYLCFRPSDTRFHLREPAEIAHLARLLTALLDTKSLESITINLDSTCDRTDPDVFAPPPICLGPMLAKQTRRNLRIILLRSFAIHHAELERFVDQLGVPLKYAGLQDIHLMSGTWADTLDVLRRVAPSRSSGLTFEGAIGAEVEVMSDDERAAVFEPRYRMIDKRSLAEAYITGKIVDNPVRASLEGVDGAQTQ